MDELGKIFAFSKNFEPKFFCVDGERQKNLRGVEGRSSRVRFVDELARRRSFPPQRASFHFCNVKNGITCYAILTMAFFCAIIVAISKIVVQKNFSNFALRQLVAEK